MGADGRVKLGKSRFSLGGKEVGWRKAVWAKWISQQGDWTKRERMERLEFMGWNANDSRGTFGEREGWLLGMEWCRTLAD